MPKSERPEGLATRQRIMQAVDRLFYRNGIRAVGVDAIVQELGISKKTLYRHFRSKGEMVEAYLADRCRPLPVSTKPPVEQILASFERIERQMEKGEIDRGCAFLNAIAELGEDEPNARHIAVSYKEAQRLWYRDLLTRLGVDDPDDLATQLLILINGAYSAVLTHNDSAKVRPAISAARILLKNADVNIETRPTPPADRTVAQPDRAHGARKLGPRPARRSRLAAAS
jgi:AcrR family transcriptional regulator